jgi:Uma2 family endonuclease
MSHVLKPRAPQTRSRGGDSVPPLENGDHLDQKTFHERYEAMPEDFKAELIQGRVYVRSGRVTRGHGRMHAFVSGWLGHYTVSIPGIEALIGTSVLLDEVNEPQPDCVLLVRPDYGGQTQLNDDQYIVGAPELVVEVAASTVSFDLFEKREAYEQAGVQEYLVVIVRDAQVRWLRLEGGRYVDVPADVEGVFRSRVFPGLWLNSKALLAEDSKLVLETLGKSLASPEHAEFVRQLAARKTA